MQAHENLIHTTGGNFRTRLTKTVQVRGTETYSVVEYLSRQRYAHLQSEPRHRCEIYVAVRKLFTKPDIVHY